MNPFIKQSILIEKLAHLSAHRTDIQDRLTKINDEIANLNQVSINIDENIKITELEIAENQQRINHIIESIKIISDDALEILVNTCVNEDYTKIYRAEIKRRIAIDLEITRIQCAERLRNAQIEEDAHMAQMLSNLDNYDEDQVKEDARIAAELHTQINLILPNRR